MSGSSFDLIHADTLRHFPELVRELGADPAALLGYVGIDPVVLDGGCVGYRAMASLLEHAATALQCPDFGMRLARKQGGNQVFGLMGVIMKNSGTLGAAVRYVVNRSHAHSLATRLCLRSDRRRQHHFVAHEILLEGLTNKRQIIEQFMLLGHLNAIEITGGRARVREVSFRYEPLSPRSTYRRYFGCEIRFRQQADGVIFSERDMRCPIVDPNVLAYEAATSLIDSQLAQVSLPLHAQVRAVIVQFIETDDCSDERVARELHLHTRTLRRRLKAEATSFQAIKAQVRRDFALSYLQQTDLPVARIAEKLGYAAHSVFTRSCFDWFSASPTQLRLRAAAR
jgi:AraC-like DNA-binding protein